MATHKSLASLFTAIADAIRAKTGKTGTIVADNFPSEIAEIVTLPDTEQATPSITVSTAGLITASATQTAGYVAAGTKSATKQLTVQAAKTVTPTTSNQTAVASGRYTTGAVTVKGDSNLKAANIAKGVSIFGVSGSYTGAPVLLWTNASPASAMGAQTITVASGYDAYLIRARSTDGYNTVHYAYSYVVNDGTQQSISGGGYDGGGWIRLVTPSGTSLTFTKGTGAAAYTTTKYSVPHKIWGVKWTL